MIAEDLYLSMISQYIKIIHTPSDYLKRNTDSVKCAMENDVFGSLPDESPLDELEAVDG